VSQPEDEAWNMAALAPHTPFPPKPALITRPEYYPPAAERVATQLRRALFGRFTLGWDGGANLDEVREGGPVADLRLLLE
jgi:hypothetical protein